MDSFKELTSKKVYGVPVVYLAGVFVGVLVFIAWRMKPVNVDDEEKDTTNPKDTPEGDPDYSGLATNGTVTVQQGTDPATVTPVTPETNDRWIAKGVQYCVSNGLASGGEAQLALSLYVNGSELSYAQGVIRDAVIKQYGTPPESVVPGGTKEQPARRQGNPPTKHTVQGTNDNTYTKLGALYYGRTDGPTLDLLQFHNAALGHGGPWSKGTVVTIPVYRPPVYFTATKSIRTAAAIASKNSITRAQLEDLNDGMKFPVAIGKKVRVR